jgi:hypothetical protein
VIIDWTLEILTQFIEFYRSHNCLWKIKAKEYTNKNFKNQAYDELTNYCKIYFRKADRGFVTKKIQNIRAAQSFVLNIFLGKVSKITTIMPAQAIALLLLTLFFKRLELPARSFSLPKIPRARSHPHEV